MNEAVKVLHICGNFRIGGITTFIKSIVGLNKQFTTIHDLLFVFDANENNLEHYCQVHNLNFKWKKFISYVKKANKILNYYNVILIHTAHPVIVLPLLFSNKKNYLFQHGMAVRRGFLVKKMLKKIWYSLLPIFLNAKIIYSSEFAVKKSRKLGILLQKRRNIIIPFGVKINSRERMLRNINNKHTVKIGMAGSLTIEKRNDVVLRSLASYSGRVEINIIIAGDGPELSDLKNIAKSIKSNRVKVNFIGSVDDMDIFYREIDFFIFSSRDESFGLAVIEALTRLIPVVVFSDVGGCLPCIKEGKTGFIIRDETVGLNVIWKMLNDSPERIYSMSKFISDINMDEYDIVNTRIKLDTLAKSSIRS